MNIYTQKYSQDLRRYYRLPAVQVSLTLVLSVFVMAIFITFALRPTITSIVTLNKTIEDSKKTVAQLETKVKSLQAASNLMEGIKEPLPSLNASIPNTGAQYTPLTMAVESLAFKTNVTIESSSLGSTVLFSRILTPFTPNKNQSVVAMPFTLRIVGGYVAIESFLTQLLQMDRIIGIDTATMTREAGTKTESGGVSLNISGSAYYLADEGQLQKAMPEKKGRK